MEMETSIHDEDLGPEPTPLPSRSLDETTWLPLRPSAVQPLPPVGTKALGFRTSHGRVIVVPAPVAVIGIASIVMAAGLAVFDPPAVHSAALEHKEHALLRWENADRTRIASALDALEPELRELRRVALSAGIVPPETSFDCGSPDAEHLAGHLSEAAWLTSQLLSRTKDSPALDMLPSRSPIDLTATWVVTDGPATGGVHVSSNMGTRSDPFTGEKKRHQGLDLSAPAGTPVTAPASGVVEFAGSVAANDDHARALLGNHVMVRHGDTGYVTLYAHLEKVTVKTGQAVKPGQQLGTVGSTGRSTAPHLHYQVMRGSGASRENMDPLYFITDSVLIRDGRDVWYVPQRHPAAAQAKTAQVMP